jgi:crotonobetaine/carnitine-CoA ligase
LRVDTIDGLLARQAAERPTQVFLRFRQGDLTFAETDRRVTRLAHGLAGLGIGRGSLVPVLMANGADMAITWLALCRLGAVATLLNTAFRGPALAHALRITGADTAIVHADLLGPMSDVAGDVPALGRLVLAGGDGGDGGDAAATGRFDAVPFAALDVDDDTPHATAHGWRDAAMVLFTSGTTGPSKGCVLSHRYALRQAELMIEHLRFRPDDVLYCPFPLFHIDATVLTVAPALVLGTTAAIGERFSASGFWDEVRAFGATVFDFMGATLTMLHKQPVRRDDADNPSRLGWGVPVPVEFATGFERRFGVQLVELYGSTDAGVPIYHPVDEVRRPGSCGRPVDAYDIRLVDDDGHPVTVGEVGELLVRPNEPSLIADGYHGMPDATLDSRRDLWFHTGDLLRADADGYLYFVGRRTDSIRRRGENISAFEVEEVVKLHPHVLDASELSEQDVMVAVVPRRGARLDPAALIDFCRGRMGRHMLPRYVDVVATLPRTPTEKVEKRSLAERGVTASTWDAERA